MARRKKSRKKEILEEARREFIAHGLDGARLHAITDNIGVTKAMIHYYFGTKQNLFEEVFRVCCGRLMGDLMTVLEKDTPLLQKLEQFISQMIDRFDQHSELLTFVLQELNGRPGQTVKILSHYTDFDPSILEDQLGTAISNYEIAPVSTTQLLGNIISLCMFPYAGEQFSRELLTLDEQEYESFLEDRKDIVADTIINWLTS